MKTIGVFGLGSIGMRHANNLRTMGHNVRAYDPDMQRRLAFNGVLWEEMEVLQSDAIVVASPSDDHSWRLLTDAHRLPMFVEKPIGISGQDAAELRVVVKHSKPIMVGYNLRFHSCVKKTLAWLPSIGEPQWAHFVCGQYNSKPAYLRDGVILNWSHEIDLAMYFLGPTIVKGCSARIKDGSDDIAIILLDNNGCQISIHLDYITHPEQRFYQIFGRNGRIEVDLVRRIARLENSDGALIEQFIGQDSFDKNYVEEMQAFIDLMDGKQTIGASGTEGLRVLEACLDARKMAGIT